MGRKVGITLEDIVGAAATIADRDGLAAATLSAVAKELGIKTPSLYNHVAGLPAMRRELALHASRHLTAVFTAATQGKEPRAAIRAAAHAYRTFATEHSGLYESLLPAVKPGEDDELYEAMAAPVRVLFEEFAELGVAEEEAVHIIRGLRAMLHGFVDLERKGGFGMPVDLDRSFHEAIDLMVDRIPERSW
ncbi:MAG: TetR/AcrR family transcriptional regulator [Acidimicrobiia bacterium]|nr:TetR/AcrR family transcriptional regulator [Acidimicrobiia bacterium]